MLARFSAVAIAVAALGLATAPAASAKLCNTAPYAEDIGPTYVSGMDVKGVTCATGKQFLITFHKCRKAPQSLSRRCRNVSGYSCRERGEKGPALYSARVTCTKGSRRIVHTFSQDR